MLVLSREAGQEIQIGPDIRVTVVRVAGGRVTLGIDAPRTVGVRRGDRQPRR